MLTIILLVSLALYTIRRNEHRRRDKSDRLGTVLTYSIMLGGAFALMYQTPFDDRWDLDGAMVLTAAFIAILSYLWATSITKKYYLENKTYVAEPAYVWKSFMSGFAVMLLFLTVACTGIVIRGLILILTLVDRFIYGQMYLAVPEMTVDGVAAATIVLGIGVLIFDLWQSRGRGARAKKENEG